ncbi:MAG: hypothetical protein QM638_12030 [Nocardioides sp.]|uniref:MutS-related protein n=1 Tax=Nocardioides sp. TaxID=35761 RepID=UPI0039E33C12
MSGRGAMTPASFSILFGGRRPERIDETPEPSYFGDLRLDQLVAGLTGDVDQFHLAPLFRAMVADRETLRLRQDVFDDIQQPGVRQTLDGFSQDMAAVHSALRASQNLRVGAQKDRWHLNAAAGYCTAVRTAVSAIGGSGLRSGGLREIVRGLRDLAGSDDFRRLDGESSRLEEQLRALDYSVFLQGARITVGAYDGESDYGEHIVNMFSRFRQHDQDPEAKQTQQRRRKVRYAGGDPVRERIVALVAELHPALFAELAAFRARHPSFLDPTVSLFYRELQFYLRYQDLRQRLEGAGLPTVRPTLREEHGVTARDVYDIVLASQQATPAEPGGSRTGGSSTGGSSTGGIVGNDLDLAPYERRVVISGPNQGGKTTFSRTIAQIHHLAALGCPVPGSEVALAPPDRIFTHFEREELGHRTGKLEDDLLRIQAILEQATSHSVVVLNEIFASTTTADAVDLARGVLDRLSASGALCLCVTFLDEIAQAPHTVTLVAQVDPDDVTRRTFRVIRAPADGRAYATALAVKHGLTYDDVRRRVQ